MAKEAELKAFSDKLYKLMMAHGLRQTDLAQSMGVSRDLISLYVRGKAIPSGLALVDLAKALDVRPEELVPDVDAMTERDVLDDLDYAVTFNEESDSRDLLRRARYEIARLRFELKERG
jgi:transcriptional regulator with XRE-family HTH domain